MVFILILTIGFVYELGKGALDYSKFPHSKNYPPTAQGPGGSSGPPRP